MTNISQDNIRNLLSKVVKNIDDYTVSVKNEEKNGFLGEVIFVDLIDKKGKDDLHFVIKQSLPIAGAATILFENEIHFYKTVWPAFISFWKEKTGKSLPEFVPKCFATSREPYGLVLKNISYDGFRLYPKTELYDDSYCRIVFERYGLFHGLSLAFRKYNPRGYQDLAKPLKCILEYTFQEKRFFTRSMKKFLLEIKKEFDVEKQEKVLEKIDLYIEKGNILIANSVKYNDDNCVIIHGDGWSNNVFIKYDSEESPVDLRFIDFQNPVGVSPVLDLSYLFYTGCSKTLLGKLYDYLKIYHDSLSKIVRECGYEPDDVYSFQQLKDEWKKHCKFAFGAGIVLWRTKLVDPNFVPDLTQYKPDEELKPMPIAVGKEKQYKEVLKDLILHMYENDFF